MNPFAELLRDRDWRWMLFVQRAIREGLELTLRREVLRVEGYRFLIHRKPQIWSPTPTQQYYRFQVRSPRIHVITSWTGKQVVYLPHERPQTLYLLFRLEDMPTERWPTPEAWEEARARRTEILYGTDDSGEDMPIAEAS